MEKKRESLCAVYEIRYNADTFKNEDELKDVLSKWAKHWTFQLEEGDGGYKHYQGRISLLKKRRLSELKSAWTENLPNYICQTVNPEFKNCGYSLDGIFYSLKEDTRINGPWTEQDIVEVKTKQLMLFDGFAELYPWQKKVKDIVQKFDMRSIHLIYDKHGHAGKSIFVEHLEYENLVEDVPPYRLMSEIFEWVCGRPIRKAYIFDMPRGMKKDKLGEFYSGIEVIKNGVAYDKRNRPKKIRFDRPAVVIFSNELPDFSLMSLDRWQVWEMTESHDLIPYGTEECLQLIG
jgi:hypothetical protein